MNYLLFLTIICESSSYSVTRRFKDPVELMVYVENLELVTNKWSDETVNEQCWVSEAEWRE